MAITQGFGGSIYYVAESAYKTTVSNPAYKRFSNIVESVKVKKSRSKEGFRSIDAPGVVDFLAKTTLVDVEITYILHRVDPLDTCMTRTNGAVPSYQLEVSANTANSSGDVYYTLNGVKFNVKCAVKVDDYYRVTLTGMGALLTQASAQPSVGSGSRESALNTGTYPFLTFSGGSITNAGAAWEAGVVACEFTVDQGFERVAAIGSATISNLVEGPLTVTGTADIYVENGGGTLLTSVESDTGVSIVLNTGASGAPKFTIGGAEFSDFEVTLDNQAAVVKVAEPFEGTSITVGTV